ncbi:MAG: ABC transporter permease [Tissierellia bacterium]|nr:ABC transporter permease [Tissierellia bacterium]
MIINKRIIREFKKNFLKYIALMLIVATGLAIIVGLTGSVDSIEVALKDLHHDNNLEDGHFSVAFPLEKSEIKDLEKNRAEIEESFYYDFNWQKDKIIRLVRNRELVNRFYAIEGRLPEKNDEIFLELHFSEKSNLNIGDKIEIADKEYKIVGIGIAPDYTTCLQAISDASPAPDTFGLGTVVEDSIADIEESEDLICTEYNYIFSLSGENDRKEFRKDVKSLEYLTSYVDISDNPRVQQELKEIVSQRNLTLVFGLFFMLIMAYMLAVFTSGHMKNERETIGTFYAMGYKKSELIRHYIRMPIVILIIASILGLIGGYFFIDVVVRQHQAYYDLPMVKSILMPYQYIYSIVITIILGFIFNLIVISRQLSTSPIELLRNRVRCQKMKYGKYKERPFLKIFSKRIIQSNKEGYIALMAGIILSVVLLIYGFCTYESLNAMPADSIAGVIYENQYIFKLPKKDDEYKGQRAMTLSMNSNERISNASIPVQINGLEKGNEFFPFKPSGDGELSVSTATAEKMGWEKGDKVKLTKQPENEVYEFKVGTIVDYTSGMNIFLDMDFLNKKLGYEDGIYNTVYSNEELDLPAEDILSHNKMGDLESASKGYIDAMKGTVNSMVSGSIILYVLILYLMLKIVIEREAYNISLIKIMGYSDAEVSRLYFWNSLIIFIISLAIGFPLGRVIMDYVMPMTIATMPVNVRVLISPKYIGIMLLIMGTTYLIIGFIIRHKLKKVPYTVVLKSRE